MILKAPKGLQLNVTRKLTMPLEDRRRHSPAAERNAGPILAELLRLLPPQGLMLEIASGTGQHAAHFSAGLPHWQWQPTDANAETLDSIADWCAGLSGVRPPAWLDLLEPKLDAWLKEPVDAIFCANLIHIAPWACTPALMQLASRWLQPQGLLLTYGPYLEADVSTAPSNAAFDADLRRRNADWGIRRLEAVAAEAERCGLHLRERIAMPANNLLLVWARVG